MKRLVILASFALAACAASVDPTAKASLDGWSQGLAAGSTRYGDDSARLPPAVGQWVEYRDLDAEGQPSRRKQKIVGAEAGAYWVELETESYDGSNVIKALIALDDWAKPDNIEIRRIIIQPAGEAPQELPVLIGQLAAKPLLAAFRSQTTEGPMESVSVPAGVFEARRVTSEAETIFGTSRATAWVNGKVPVTATVKVETDDGGRAELVDFGTSGATSVITGAVAPAS